MKKIFILLISVFPISAFAVFSAFEVVKPGTEHEKTLDVKVTHTKNMESCIVQLLPFGYDQKQAWLVVASRPLSEKEQELRRYIWGESPMPASIELIVKLSPTKFAPVDRKNAKDSRYVVTLKSELAPRSYVYIDFPQIVLDGGYYYSLPLGVYCGDQN
jgi:hypothetical protein